MPALAGMGSYCSSAPTRCNPSLRARVDGAAVQVRRAGQVPARPGRAGTVVNQVTASTI